MIIYFAQYPDLSITFGRAPAAALCLRIGVGSLNLFIVSVLPVFAHLGSPGAPAVIVSFEL